MVENPEALFKQISHGVYVIGVTDGTHQNAFTAAWAMQVSFNPLLLAISINPEHYSYQLLQAGGVCTVNVLGQKHYAIAEHFGRSANDKMIGFQWQKDKTGAPILSESLAYFDCQVSHYTDAVIIKSQFVRSFRRPDLMTGVRCCITKRVLWMGAVSYTNRLACCVLWLG